jgi:thiosulfate dehydrogenase (quinone) large subunit
MRLGTFAARVMYLLMWIVVLARDNNQVIDDHIIGALAVFVLALYGAAVSWAWVPGGRSSTWSGGTRS